MLLEAINHQMLHTDRRSGGTNCQTRKDNLTVWHASAEEKLDEDDFRRKAER